MTVKGLMLKFTEIYWIILAVLSMLSFVLLGLRKKFLKERDWQN